MKRMIVFSISLCCLCSFVNAQKRSQSDTKGILYTKEKAFDLRFLTHGWAVDVYLGMLKSYYKTQYYRFGISNLRDAKEKRFVTDFSATGFSTGFRHYIYGKQNYVYTLHGGWGMKRYYTEKAEKKGVALAINYSGGLMAGLLIPYYLDVSDPQKRGSESTIKHSPETSVLFLDRNVIRGKGGVFRGVSEATLVPAIYVRTGVHLDWGAFDEFLKAVEIGVQLQVFTKKMPIMVNEESRPYFFNLYVSLQVGKRN